MMSYEDAIMSIIERHPVMPDRIKLGVGLYTILCEETDNYHLKTEFQGIPMDIDYSCPDVVRLEFETTVHIPITDNDDIEIFFEDDYRKDEIKNGEENCNNN